MFERDRDFAVSGLLVVHNSILISLVCSSVYTRDIANMNSASTADRKEIERRNKMRERARMYKKNVLELKRRAEDDDFKELERHIHLQYETISLMFNRIKNCSA